MRSKQEPHTLHPLYLVSVCRDSCNWHSVPIMLCRGERSSSQCSARRRRLSSERPLDYPTRSIRSRGARAGRGRAIGPKNIIYSAAEWRASEVPGPRAPRAQPGSLRNRIPTFFVNQGLRSIRLNAGYVIVFTHP